jgi:hypothetical protein
LIAIKKNHNKQRAVAHVLLLQNNALRRDDKNAHRLDDKDARALLRKDANAFRYEGIPRCDDAHAVLSTSTKSRRRERDNARRQEDAVGPGHHLPSRDVTDRRLDNNSNNNSHIHTTTTPPTTTTTTTTTNKCRLLYTTIWRAHHNTGVLTIVDQAATTNDNGSFIVTDIREKLIASTRLLK